MKDKSSANKPSNATAEDIINNINRLFDAAVPEEQPQATPSDALHPLNTNSATTSTPAPQVAVAFSPRSTLFEASIIPPGPYATQLRALQTDMLDSQAVLVDQESDVIHMIAALAVWHRLDAELRTGLASLEALIAQNALGLAFSAENSITAQLDFATTVQRVGSVRSRLASMDRVIADAEARITQSQRNIDELWIRFDSTATMFRLILERQSPSRGTTVAQEETVEQNVQEQGAAELLGNEQEAAEQKQDLDAPLD
ncbi:hypothetical protein BT63DRAFT_462380 [Microthyrium microscopicum]|uniref:Uncharacterized protein n=1 Tax=Microthyrium microscopicum TaxID=703497 RepID=A0A6A6URD1_9PEZI|nr:hypothetical protein BT63DRAFT_462380 [Microthyrium microscopicum]